jgi:hypothetical protein
MKIGPKKLRKSSISGGYKIINLKEITHRKHDKNDLVEPARQGTETM